jgi:hypothetical protein
MATWIREMFIQNADPIVHARIVRLAQSFYERKQFKCAYFNLAVTFSN